MKRCHSSCPGLNQNLLVPLQPTPQRVSDESRLFCGHGHAELTLTPTLTLNLTVTLTPTLTQTLVKVNTSSNLEVSYPSRGTLAS